LKKKRRRKNKESFLIKPTCMFHGVKLEFENYKMGLPFNILEKRLEIRKGCG